MSGSNSAVHCSLRFVAREVTGCGDLNRKTCQRIDSSSSGATIGLHAPSRGFPVHTHALLSFFTTRGAFPVQFSLTDGGNDQRHIDRFDANKRLTEIQLLFRIYTGKLAILNDDPE